jgi:hypothetical protein
MPTRRPEARGNEHSLLLSATGYAALVQNAQRTKEIFQKVVSMCVLMRALLNGRREENYLWVQWPGERAMISKIPDACWKRMWWIGTSFAPKKMQPSELFLRKKPLGCIEDALIPGHQ